MSRQHHQTGLTLISWLILLALIMFVVWFGFRIFPIYYNYFEINASINTVMSKLQAGETPDQIRLGIDNLITINNISDVSVRDHKQINIAPLRDGDGYILTLDYDSQTSFIGNVNLLVYFHKVYKARPR